eukprot:534879-Lingulodinium_polyedra.AAC.1
MGPAHGPAGKRRRASLAAQQLPARQLALPARDLGATPARRGTARKGGPFSQYNQRPAEAGRGQGCRGRAQGEPWPGAGAGR